ncbi:MAG: HipA N-terminal domain-containing protein [Bdellovibrionales bacterium]|nr:HipA N-terminal domain-containing protein [Bdellovibrionales bacterium]
MLDKKIIAVDVYLQRRKSREFVGQLAQENTNFIFSYNDSYVYGSKSIPLGPDLPLSSKTFKSKVLFPSFEDRIPSKKNPAYKEYCKSVGIDPTEKDALVLVATLGRKGPSSFIFVPVYEDGFLKQDLLRFRKDLNLSVREFADLFDFSDATIHRIESGKSSGKDSLKRIELYYRFPEVALFEITRHGFKINDDKRRFVEKILKDRQGNGKN